MSVITLTTDLGDRDHYTALIKGNLLSRISQVTLVDISHNIEHFNIVQAAYVFRNCWAYFPVGSVHLIAVNDLAEASRRYLLVACQGHFFVAADNGLLPMILGDQIAGACVLPWPEEAPFPIAELFAHTAAQLAVGIPPEEIGQWQEEIVRRIVLQPVVTPDQIRGTVIYIDGFDNVVLNIEQALFEHVGGQRPFALYFKRHDPITELSRHYSDVRLGEPLCRFNSAGLLEIAINTGRAASLLGLKIDDAVQIEFGE